MSDDIDELRAELSAELARTRKLLDEAVLRECNALERADDYKRRAALAEARVGILRDTLREEGCTCFVASPCMACRIGGLIGDGSEG